jgi:large repetitive protein
MRFIRVLVLVSALACVFASVASAGGYTDASYYTPIGKVGVPYSHTVQWKPGTGCPPYTYAFVGGELPPGLHVSSDGHITGTPTREGKYTFYIRQTDLCGPEGEGNAPFVITIQAGAPPVPPLSVNSASPPTAEAELSYSATLTASGGGNASQSWSVSGGQLPPGLTLASNGHIAGTPTSPGAYTFTVTVGNGTTSASKSFTITVIPGITLKGSPVLPTAEVRTPYNATLTTVLGVSGGAPPYRFAPVSGFPFGVGFDTAAGTIFGSPRQPGTLKLTISITDANQARKEVTLSLPVLPKLHIVPLALHRGHVGAGYRARVTVTGGQEPLWSVSSGRLPSGLKLSSRTGLITGVPRHKGSTAFTVTVRDALGAKVSIRYTLVVGT